VSPARTAETLREAFELHSWIVADSGCWEWADARDFHGYGALTYEQRTRKAHRVAYESWVGPVPDGHHVLHSCDNPPCINPDHLSTGTHADNMRDMAARARSGKTKLTWDQVRDIRTRAGQSGASMAREFSVSTDAIYRILRGDTWRYGAMAPLGNTKQRAGGRLVKVYRRTV